MKLLKYLIAIIEACHESKTVGTSLCDKRGKHILFRRKDQRKNLVCASSDIMSFTVFSCENLLKIKKVKVIFLLPHYVHPIRHNASLFLPYFFLTHCLLTCSSPPRIPYYNFTSFAGRNRGITEYITSKQ